MLQFNPAYPGKFIERVYLKPMGLRSIDVARSLKISSSAFSRLIHGKSRVTPIMSLKLSKVIGRSPESWLAMQRNYDLWKARAKFDSQNH